MSLMRYGILLCLYFTLVLDSAHSVALYGGGTSSTLAVWGSWVKGYAFARDDVQVSFNSLGTNLALSNYASGYIDFMCLDRGIPAQDAALYGDLAQFPIAGHALVLAYDISTLDPTDPPLVLDRETVGRIWAGDIAMWDDSAIQALNPLIASKLPALNITIGYSDNAGISVPEVFKRALVSFSSSFGAALDAAGGLFSAMPPALRGTGMAAGTSSLTRVSWLKAHTNAMTFVAYPDAVSEGVKWASMINKAGTLVQASTATVQSAMAAFLPDFGQSNFSIDIYDASGQDSWPLALMSYVSLGRVVTNTDCKIVSELLNFIAWIHTNDGASQALLDLNFVPLDVSLRKRLIDLLNTVTCDNKQALTTDYLVGVGPSMPLYSEWAVARSSSLSTKVKYYVASASAEAPQQLATYDSDFGATDSGLQSSWSSTISDLALLPITAYAVVPGYNIPELVGHTLVLTFDVLAAIYMNDVTMWNDPSILAINTAEVAALLPSQAIFVCTQSDASETTNLFTSVLNATVPAFASVGTGTVVNFPVDGNRSLVGENAQALIRNLIFTPYSIGIARLQINQTTPVVTLLPKDSSGETQDSAAVSLSLGGITSSASNSSSRNVTTGIGTWTTLETNTLGAKQSFLYTCELEFPADSSNSSAAPAPTAALALQYFLFANTTQVDLGGDPPVKFDVFPAFTKFNVRLEDWVWQSADDGDERAEVRVAISPTFTGFEEVAGQADDFVREFSLTGQHTGYDPNKGTASTRLRLVEAVELDGKLVTAKEALGNGRKAVEFGLEMNTSSLVLSFARFNKSVVYDPDLGVLLTEKRGGDAGSSDHMGLIIGVAVAVPLAIVIVVLVIGAAVVTVYCRKRLSVATRDSVNFSDDL